MNTSPWIRSFRWDFFWMFSGFWIPTLFLLLPFAQSKALIFVITICFWIAHRLSSVYLGLCVREYAAVIQAKKSYFVFFPLALLFLLLLFLFLPEAIIPIPRLWRFFFLGSIDYFFSLYHFSVQHYGVLSVYRGKLAHGQKDSFLLKWDWFMCLAISGLGTLIMDLFMDDMLHLGLFSKWMSSLDLPVIFFWVKMVLTVLLGLFWLQTANLYRRKKQGLARLLYFSTLCYMTLISLYVSPILYFALIQIQHWFVSLGLVTHMARQSKNTPEISPWHRFWSWVNQHKLGPLLVLILLSLALTPFLEADYYILSRFDAGDLSLGFILAKLPESNLLFLLGGLAFFSSFVHYIYDRGVFRFSEPLTRQAALSLLHSSSD